MDADRFDHFVRSSENAPPAAASAGCWPVSRLASQLRCGLKGKEEAQEKEVQEWDEEVWQALHPQHRVLYE